MRKFPLYYMSKFSQSCAKCNQVRIQNSSAKNWRVGLDCPPLKYGKFLFSYLKFFEAFIYMSLYQCEVGPLSFKLGRKRMEGHSSEKYSFILICEINSKKPVHPNLIYLGRSIRSYPPFSEMYFLISSRISDYS